MQKKKKNTGADFAVKFIIQHSMFYPVLGEFCDKGA